MSLKVVIVGCGKIADGHAEEIQKQENARLVAVCDLELLMAEQLARRFGVPSFYDNFAECLEKEQPDVVHITTPPQVHLLLAKMAIDAGAHVYVEKPLAMNAAEGEELIAYAEAHDKNVTVGHSFNFDPPALLIRDLVKQGQLGDVVHMESFFGYNLSGPFGATILGDSGHWVHALPGKLFHNNIDHMLNKILDFLPDERPEVNAFAFNAREKRYGDVRDDLYDELRVVIRGEKCTAYGTFCSHSLPVQHYLRVFGSKNSAHVDYNIRTVTFAHSPSLPSAIGRVLPAFKRGWQYQKEGWRNVFRFAKSKYHFFMGMNELIRQFYESVEHGTEPPISHRDMRRMSWLLDEIFAQISATQEVR